MASYLVMKPPGPDRDPDSVRFVRDGFSWAALVLPLIWMLFHRMWLYAVIFLVIDAVLAALVAATGHETAGTMALLVLNLLIALESGEIRRLHLSSKGWNLDRILSAGSLSEAEEIYFSGQDFVARHPIAPAPVSPAATALPRRDPWGGSALGLFDPYKGR